MYLHHVTTYGNSSCQLSIHLNRHYSKDYPYIFNAVAFNFTSMEWMVIGQVRLDKQNKEAYSLAFKKILERCSSIREDFEVGQTLLGIITDWSDAEINGLEAVVGHAKVMEILKDVSSVLASVWQIVLQLLQTGKKKRTYFLR